MSRTTLLFFLFDRFSSGKSRKPSKSYKRLSVSTLGMLQYLRFAFISPLFYLYIIIIKIQ
ncbi:MAG: hypothetical protein C0417_08500 [Chlorobiaceae bacterium]|nr:hypothetical protein [Chlorobiaceae bacterium]